MEMILSFVAGIAVAAIVAYFIIRQTKLLAKARIGETENEMRSQMARVETDLVNARATVDELKEDKKKLNESFSVTVAEKSSLAADLKVAQELLATTKENAEKDAENKQKLFEAELNHAREAMRSQFEKELEERSTSMKKANKEQMELVVKPLQDELGELRKLVNNSKEEHIKNMSSLEAGIKAVFEHDRDRDKITKNLADALKNRGKVQGDWGEQVLEDILRDSGLRKGEEYFVQENVKDEEGKNLRPDVVVKTPDSTNIVIDSKVSLTAYTDYVGAENDEDRKAALKANYDSIMKHVDELTKKDYSKLVKDSVPHVLMFVPNEGAYILAMNHDPQLGTRAYNKGVIIVNPTNLMMVLKLILLTWQNTRQEKNNIAILKAATGIYDKYAVFTEEYVKLGNQLTNARASYDKALGQLRDGKGNLSSQIENLRKLGVGSTKQIAESAASMMADEEE